GEWQLERPVPDEFADIAIERSEVEWGPIKTIDDGFVQQLRANGHDVKAMRKVLASQPASSGSRLPTNSIDAFMQAFERQRDAPKPPPPNSVFAAKPMSPLYPPGSVFDRYQPPQ